MLFLVLFVTIFFLIRGLLISIWKNDKYRLLIIKYATNAWVVRFSVTSILLLLALMDLPDTYYQVVRVVVFITSALCAIKLFDKTISLPFSIAIFVALAFNPFYQIEYECLSSDKPYHFIEYWPIAFALISSAFVTYKSMERTN